MNRARGKDEPFGDYREALREEAKVERVRLKGKWIWRSMIPVREEDETIILKPMPPMRSQKREDKRKNKTV